MPLRVGKTEHWNERMGNAKNSYGRSVRVSAQSGRIENPCAEATQQNISINRVKNAALEPNRLKR